MAIYLGILLFEIWMLLLSCSLTFNGLIHLLLVASAFMFLSSRFKIDLKPLFYKRNILKNLRRIQNGKVLGNH